MRTQPGRAGGGNRLKVTVKAMWEEIKLKAWAGPPLEDQQRVVGGRETPAGATSVSPSTARGLTLQLPFYLFASPTRM